MDISSYISGFVDGEGCFCVSFQPSKRHCFGWEVRPSFSVSQNQDRAQLLYILRDRWKCGTIRPDRSDKTIKFEVRALLDLNEKVVPHFLRYPLISKKQEDVVLFSEICSLMKVKQHRNLQGLSQIVNLAMRMNSTGKRKYTGSEILTSLHADEGIVYATGNCG